MTRLAVSTVSSVFLVVAILSMAACDDDPDNSSPSADADSDTDSDTDADTDSDPDTDADAESDANENTGPCVRNEDCEPGERCDGGVCEPIADADAEEDSVGCDQYIELFVLNTEQLKNFHDPTSEELSLANAKGVFQQTIYLKTNLPNEYFDATIEVNSIAFDLHSGEKEDYGLSKGECDPFGEKPDATELIFNPGELVPSDTGALFYGKPIACLHYKPERLPVCDDNKAVDVEVFITVEGADDIDCTDWPPNKLMDKGIVIVPEEDIALFCDCVDQQVDYSKDLGIQWIGKSISQDIHICLQQTSSKPQYGRTVEVKLEPTGSAAGNVQVVSPDEQPFLVLPRFDDEEQIASLDISLPETIGEFEYTINAKVRQCHEKLMSDGWEDKCTIVLTGTTEEDDVVFIPEEGTSVESIDGSKVCKTVSVKNNMSTGVVILDAVEIVASADPFSFEINTSQSLPTPLAAGASIDVNVCFTADQNQSQCNCFTAGCNLSIRARYKTDASDVEPSYSPSYHIVGKADCLGEEIEQDLIGEPCCREKPCLDSPDGCKIGGWRSDLHRCKVESEMDNKENYTDCLVLCAGEKNGICIDGVCRCGCVTDNDCEDIYSECTQAICGQNNECEVNEYDSFCQSEHGDPGECKVWKCNKMKDRGCYRIPVPENEECEDNNLCITSLCIQNKCTEQPGVLECQKPSNPCEVSRCDPTEGCININEVDGSECNPQGSKECTRFVCSDGRCEDEVADNGWCYYSGKICVEGECSGYKECFEDGDLSGACEKCVPGTGPVVIKEGNCRVDYNGIWLDGKCSSNGVCFPSQCYINGQLYESETNDPENTCHYCNPDMSIIEWTNRTAGYACDDDNVCTENENCNGEGVCEGGTLCPCCQPGANLLCCIPPTENDGDCHPVQNDTPCITNCTRFGAPASCQDGLCRAADSIEGISCDGEISPDENLCTSPQCDFNGICKHMDVVCDPAPDCRDGGTCNPETGVCDYPALADNTPCTDDGDLCKEDYCEAGECVHPDKECLPVDECAGSVCNPTTGDCEVSDCDPNGASCNGGSGVCDNCQCVPGKKAVYFDGLDDMVKIPDSELLDVGSGGSLTIEAWIKPESLRKNCTNEGNVILGKWYDVEAAGNNYLLCVSSTNGLTALLFDATGTKHRFDGGSIEVGRWQHVAVVMDSDPAEPQVRLYIDGVNVLTVPNPINQLFGTLGPDGDEYDFDDLYIGTFTGRHGPSIPWLFHGVIDEVRISEAAEYSIGNFTPDRYLQPTPSTIGLWHFNEGEPYATTKDSTGNDDHLGTLMNGCTWVNED